MSREQRIDTTDLSPGAETAAPSKARTRREQRDAAEEYISTLKGVNFPNSSRIYLTGLNTQKTIMAVYVISSVLCWVAAIIMMAKFNSAKAGYGESYLLIAILASVLGGVNPDGGFGRIIGIVLALFVLQMLESGLNLLGVSSYLIMALWGGILILFIALQKARS